MQCSLRVDLFGDLRFVWQNSFNDSFKESCAGGGGEVIGLKQGLGREFRHGDRDLTIYLAIYLFVCHTYVYIYM